MNQERIFYGIASFTVEKIDEKNGEELLTFLKKEGFEGTKWIDLPKINIIYVNTESMKYGLGILGIKIAENIYDEIPNHPFTITEFKSIWNVLKKHRKNKKRIDGNDRKYLNSGYSCLLVKEDQLKDVDNDFWTYLDKEKFKPLTENDTPPDWVLINVGNSTYLNLTDNPEIISYVKDNCKDALNCDEFKRIWEVIRKHRP